MSLIRPSGVTPKTAGCYGRKWHFTTAQARCVPLQRYAAIAAQLNSVKERSICWILTFLDLSLAERASLSRTVPHTQESQLARADWLCTTGTIQLSSVLHILILLLAGTLSLQMSVPTRPVGSVHQLSAASPSVLVETYHDLACPFSSQMLNTLVSDVIPKYQHKGVQWVLHQVPQPWHPYSCNMHEAALAVKAVKPGKLTPCVLYVTTS